MGFHELIAQGREPGEDGLPEGFYDELAREYDLLSEGSASRVAELQAQLQARDSEVSELKSRNYDLLMSSTADDTGNQNTQGTDEEFPAHQGIDSLFG